MRFCSACGHQFEEQEVDARMEIPGVNVGAAAALQAGGDPRVLGRAVPAHALQRHDEGLRAHPQQLPLPVPLAVLRGPEPRGVPGAGGGEAVRPALGAHA